MRNEVRILLGVLTACFTGFAQAPQSLPNGLPAWAYNTPDKVQPPAAERTGMVHLPGSNKEYEASKTESTISPPDWFPDEHPPAPRVVTGGAGTSTLACGSCHLMSGQGHPESADLAGLPAPYLARQMGYFKNGARKDAARMNAIAKTASDQDILDAAQYFASLKPIPFVKVIETATPPKTYVSNSGRVRLVSPDGGTEPIGHRILEVPEDASRTENRDPHSAFLAYVPPGSIAKERRS